MSQRIPVIGLLSAAGLSIAGNTIVAIAIPWLVMERTGSPALAGLIAAATLAPLALSSLLGGALIDRWGRRRLSIGADVLSAAAVAAIPLLDLTVGLTAASIAILVALGAVFDGPGMAARESLRPTSPGMPASHWTRSTPGARPSTGWAASSRRGWPAC